MYVKKEYESGYDLALWGIGYSFGKTEGALCENDGYPEKQLKGLRTVAKNLAVESGGEDKFLRQIKVWFYIKTSFKVWKQLDTYKIGTTAQSESTMHTVMRNEICTADFENYGTGDDEYDLFISQVCSIMNKNIKKYWLLDKDDPERERVFNRVTDIMPMSFLQARLWTANYAVLKNIYIKRRHHKLKQWHVFCEEMLKQIDHPELILACGDLK